MECNRDATRGAGSSASHAVLGARRLHALHVACMVDAMPAPKNLASRYICPVCFVTFAPSEIRGKHPLCPHCDSEAIGSELVTIDELLANVTADEIARWVEQWRATTGFYPEYHAQKLERMEALLEKARARS